MERSTIIKALRVCSIGGDCSKCPLKSSCRGSQNAAMIYAIQLLIDDMAVITDLFETLEEVCSECIDSFIDARTQIINKKHEILDKLKEVDA